MQYLKRCKSRCYYNNYKSIQWQMIVKDIKKLTKITTTFTIQRYLSDLHLYALRVTQTLLVEYTLQDMYQIPDSSRRACQ